MDSALDTDGRKVTSHVGKLLLKLPWPRTPQQQEEERLIKFASLSPFSEGTVAYMPVTRHPLGQCL